MMMVSFFFLQSTILKLYDAKHNTVENLDFEKRAILVSSMILFYMSVYLAGNVM